MGFVCSPSIFSLPAACRLFSRGVIFTPARVSLTLLSLRKNGGLLVVYILAGKCGKEFALEGSARIVSRCLMTYSNFFDGLKPKVPIGKMFPDKLC